MKCKKTPKKTLFYTTQKARGYLKVNTQTTSEAPGQCTHPERNNKTNKKQTNLTLHNKARGYLKLKVNTQTTEGQYTIIYSFTEGL